MEIVQTKVDKMEEGEILRTYTDKKCQTVEDLLSKKLSGFKVKVDNMIKDIYKNHLLKEDLIGDDENCKFKSLMEYTTSKIPDLSKRQS